MSRGPDHEVVVRVDREELRTGSKRGWRDEWKHDCDACDGSGGSRSLPCTPCAGKGFVMIQRRKPIEYVVPAGSAPGTKLRLRGFGYIGHPDVPENRGDLIIVLRPYGDGREVDELPGTQRGDESAREIQTLPAARPLNNRLSS
jgi:DnaJ-class molecular chaperone